MIFDELYVIRCMELLQTEPLSLYNPIKSETYSLYNYPYIYNFALHYCKDILLLLNAAVRKPLKKNVPLYFDNNALFVSYLHSPPS